MLIADFRSRENPSVTSDIAVWLYNVVFEGLAKAYCH